MAKQTCFVIAPIGEPGSQVRRRSDDVLKKIITPALKKRDYLPVRADRISKAGVITDQVIQHVVDDAMVVADLTCSNANVFYELALRHAIQKPFIQLIEKGQNIQFDVRSMRTIPLDLSSRQGILTAQREIIRQIDAATDQAETETPISHALHRPRGDLILPGWRGPKNLDALVVPGARQLVIVGQNIARLIGFNKRQRLAFAAELRNLLRRKIEVTLVIMPPSALQAIHFEAAEDLARFTLPGLETIRTSLGPLATRIQVALHPAATMSLISVDKSHGYLDPKFQKTAEMSGRLTVRLGPKLFDTASLDRMLYEAAKGYRGALLLPLSEAVDVLRIQLAASGILIGLEGRSNKALQPTSRARPNAKRKP